VSSYVVKVGGHALDSLAPNAPMLRALAEDIAQLQSTGTQVAVVHGGGPQIAALLNDVGRTSYFHEGLRVTDTETMRYVAMALNLVNLQLVAALNSAGVLCAGVSGVDTTLFRAEALGDPWLRAAGLPKVDAGIIHELWESGVTPIVSPVAVDALGELVNCNADAAAGALAGALGTDVLILLSDVDQLRKDPDDPSSTLETVTRATVKEMIASGAIREGMRPKMTAALDALDGGASTVWMANGAHEHALRDVLAGTALKTEVTA
jgi:acetylglutamate kinase